MNHEGDHFRTRLTHTLETFQIASTIARALGLQEDLVQAVAYAHDLGHGPFGHAGEWALAEVMKDHGGFEHNRQALRIVEILEDSYADFSGLNLTRETRDGLRKHESHASKVRPKRVRTLEAEVVDMADGIAYSNHDLDDGLRAGLLNEDQLQSLGLWKRVSSKIHKKKGMLPHQRTRLAIRRMMDLLVEALIQGTLQSISSRGIETRRELEQETLPLVVFPGTLAREHEEMKQFLRTHLYRHHLVVRMTTKGQFFIKELFKAYEAQPGLLPPDVLKRGKEREMRRAICDYLAGMTDRYATEEYARLFQPFEKIT